ncbi:Transcription factor HBP-1b(c1) [Triticum urartu]|uniref:Transcription factor HBP-1b(C1) n=1 Tax=Triticum urartu TaxID=4572 RepID=M7YS20_TRIUA|nr:Transcription factor HBP-1b(c1) [Triticum urartu]
MAAFSEVLIESKQRKNEADNTLSWLGSQHKPVPPNTFLDILHNPSVKLPTEEDLAIPDPEAQLVAALHAIPDWDVWGLDMVGPFKRSKDKKTHLLVAADKFTKWVEAKPVIKCDVETTVQFIKKGNSQSVGSTDSSSAQNTMSQAELVSPVSMRTDSGQQQQDQQEALMGLLTGGCSAPGEMSSAAVMFDMEYARWLDEDNKYMAEIQGALQAQVLDANLGTIVEDCMRHHDELFHLRAVLARSDVFHLMTGMWATQSERCFLWMAGFRPSEILKMLIPQLDPSTKQQLLGMCNLQQSSEQAEEALEQGLKQLHQSLADAVGAGPLNDGADVANYTGLMALALDRLDNLESFYRQADNLRQQTLHHMRRILTTRQTARCFVSLGEYHRRLRALSSIWASRPRE